MDALTLPKTLVEQTYDAILDAICDGTLVPGERLTQDDIAKRLNVSRQPVTNALAMLKARGFVRETGRRGVEVTALDEGLFEAIYEFRSAVEPLAVMLAVPKLTKADLEHGRSLIARGTRCTSEKNPKALLQADMDFHSFVYLLAGNVLILETMRLNWNHLRRAMGEVLKTPELLQKVWREHAAILEAMADGDGERAANLMRDHVMEAKKDVKPLLAMRAAKAARSGGRDE